MAITCNQNSGIALAVKQFTLERYKLPHFSATSAAAKSDPQLQAAIEIISRLKQAGHSAYIAGGWVRDAMLGKPPNDVDIATSASITEDLPRLFSERGVRTLQRSTARITWASGLTVEVAQLRGFVRTPTLESAYLDACLRDFTINALLYDPLTGEVLDFVGGGRDLANRVLRLPPHHLSNTPSTVVGDDPLRVLRAIRFALGLGLHIHPDTEAALAAHAPRLPLLGKQLSGPNVPTSAGLSARRVVRELSKLCSLEMRGTQSPPGPEGLVPQGFALATRWGAMAAMVPMAFARYQPTPAEVLEVQGALPLGTPLEMRLAALVNPWAEGGTDALREMAGYMQPQAASTAGRGLSTAPSWGEAQCVSDARLLVNTLTRVYDELERRLASEGLAMPADLQQEAQLVASTCEMVRNEQGQMPLRDQLVHLLSTPHAQALQAWLLAWLPGGPRDYTPLTELPHSQGAGAASSSTGKVSRSPRATVAAHLSAMRVRWGSTIIEESRRQLLPKSAGGVAGLHRPGAGR